MTRTESLSIEGNLRLDALCFDDSLGPIRPELAPCLATVTVRGLRETVCVRLAACVVLEVEDFADVGHTSRQTDADRSLSVAI